MILEPAARWAAAIATSAPLLTCISALGLVDRSRAARAMRRWSVLQHRIFGLDVTVEDRNHGRYDRPPYLFVHLNQTSLTESFLFPVVIPIPFRLVVNAEFALLPGIGPAIVALGARVIVRQWSSQARHQIDRAIEDLRRGECYGLSIEGRRSEDGQLSEYRRGAAVMAIRSGATIVPFVTLHARDRMPVGEWRIEPGPIHGVLCEAIDTTGLVLEDRHELTARLRTVAERELTAVDHGTDR